MLILGSLMFIPGFYHVRIAYYAWKGYRGYSFEDIPAFDWDTHLYRSSQCQVLLKTWNSRFETNNWRQMLTFKMKLLFWPILYPVWKVCIAQGISPLCNFDAFYTVYLSITFLKFPPCNFQTFQSGTVLYKYIILTH